MTTVSATEVQNNFGKYLQYAIDGNEIIIQKNGKEVARLISKDQVVSSITDSMRGILKKDYNDKEIRKERISAHESAD